MPESVLFQAENKDVSQEAIVCVLLKSPEEFGFTLPKHKEERGGHCVEPALCDSTQPLNEVVGRVHLV